MAGCAAMRPRPTAPWLLPIDANAVAAALGRQGLLTVVKDLGLRGLYQGAVSVQDGDVAASLSHYFEKSEQTASLVLLGAALDGEGVSLQPAGCSSNRCPAPKPGLCSVWPATWPACPRWPAIWPPAIHPNRWQPRH